MNGFQRLASVARLLPALAVVLVAACGSAGSGEDSSSTGSVGEPDRARSDILGQEARPAAGEAWVIFGADTVVAEVARTPAERERGLQNRDEVPDGSGMLFVFEEEAPRSFWMKDTYVALDIAYMNADFRIVSIHQMEALDESTYDSEAPAMFALEVRQGWFAERGIEPGDVAEVVFGG